MTARFLLQILIEAVRDTAQKVESDRVGYRTSYLNIYRGIDALKAGEWLGEAGESFAEQITSFRRDFELLDSYLGELAAYLKKTAADYAALEYNLASGASNLPDLEMEGV